MKKITALALVCALFTSCSAKTTNTSPSPDSASDTPNSENSVSVDVNTDTRENDFFIVFKCRDKYLGADNLALFTNDYKPGTDMNDGEFIEVNADFNLVSESSGENRYYPEIGKLISETPVDYDTAIEKYGIPFIGDVPSSPYGISYYKNNSGTYIICNTDENLRIYLNGEFIGVTPNGSPAHYKRLASNPELCEIIHDGGVIPEGGSDISYISFEGNEYSIDVEHLHSAILSGLGATENYNDLPSEPFTAEFEKNCKDNGLFAKLYITEGLDFEMYGNVYDVDYFVVCSETPDGKAYISINGEDMKEFPSDAVDSIKSLMH